MRFGAPLTAFATVWMKTEITSHSLGSLAPLASTTATFSGGSVSNDHPPKMAHRIRMCRTDICCDHWCDCGLDKSRMFANLLRRIGGVSMSDAANHRSPGSADPLCKWTSASLCDSCGALPGEKCIKGGPTEKYPQRRYCKDDQSCCDFCCGN